MTDTLFDIRNYEAEEPTTPPDVQGDYEDPAYITPNTGGIDGGKTAVLRYLYAKLPFDGMHPLAIAQECDISRYRAEGLAATEGHLFESVPKEGYFVIRLTESGKKVAKLVAEHLPKDAKLLGESLGYSYIKLKWSAFGGAQQQVFKLTPDTRKYGDGWAYIESRVLHGKYEQFYLHYQYPKQPKRSKYISKSKLAKIKDMVTNKKPVSEILTAISAKEKSK